jgi:dolichol-phosphate mannosyltransferase
MNNANWQLPTFDRHEFAPRQTEYCVCIPIINEGERIRRELAKMREYNIPDSADIILLDGGSTDGSTDHNFLREQGVRTLLVKTGAGKLSAQLRMGYAYALQEGYAGIVTIDGNDKDNVEAIPDFLDALKAGWDFIQGSRFVPGGQAINTPLSRYLAIKLIHAPFINLAAGFRYTDTTNGYRGYSRRLLLDERIQPFRDVFDTYELLAYLSIRAPRIGLRIKEIAVTRRYPPAEKTPTKIKGLRGNLSLFRILIRAVMGSYDPDQKSRF